jgi:hypothetical protein
MMRRVMSVDIKRPHAPRTPRKIRMNPPEPSPEAARNTSRQRANTSGSADSTGSPEATRSTGFAVPNRDLASAKEASRRMEILTNAISPRKLPEDRFNSIVKRLNYAATSTNGVNSTHPTQDDQSVAGASDVSSKTLPKKHPRKLSVSHNSTEKANGVNRRGS